MISLWQRFKNLFHPHRLNRKYWFQDLNNSADVRRAFLWDGKDRAALREFLGELQVKWHCDGAVTVAGYGQIYMRPYTYIWEDSDGYDSGPLFTVIQRFAIYRNPECTSTKSRASK